MFPIKLIENRMWAVISLPTFMKVRVQEMSTCPVSN